MEAVLRFASLTSSATQQRHAAPEPLHSSKGKCWQHLEARRCSLLAPPPRRRRPAAAGAQQQRAPQAAVGSAPQAASRPGNEYFESDRRPIILYDGVCRMCNGGVNFMLDWDKDGTFRLAALQSPAGRRLLQRSGRAPDDLSSIVLVEEGGSYIKAEAVLRIAARLQLPLTLVAAALGTFPAVLKDGVYDLIASNRYNILGRMDVCRLGDARFEERFIET